MRRGHRHGASLGPGNPVFEQSCGMGLVIGHMLAILSGVSQDPTAGKSAATNPKSIHALSDRYGTLTCLDMYASWRECLTVEVLVSKAVILRRMPPSTIIGTSEAP